MAQNALWFICIRFGNSPPEPLAAQTPSSASSPHSHLTFLFLTQVSIVSERFRPLPLTSSSQLTTSSTVRAHAPRPPTVLPPLSDLRQAMTHYTPLLFAGGGRPPRHDPRLVPACHRLRSPGTCTHTLPDTHTHAPRHSIATVLTLVS